MTIHEELSRHLSPARLAAVYAETCKPSRGPEPQFKTPIWKRDWCECGNPKTIRSANCRTCADLKKRDGRSEAEIKAERQGRNRDRMRLRSARNRSNPALQRF